jgi:hypothetical protein
MGLAEGSVAPVRGAPFRCSTRSGWRPGRGILIRVDAGVCTHAFVQWLVGQRLQYSIGFTLPVDFARTLEHISEDVWTPAYDTDGRVRQAAHFAEVTDLLDPLSWPPGMRGHRPPGRPPGAQAAPTTAADHPRSLVRGARRAQLRLAAQPEAAWHHDLGPPRSWLTTNSYPRPTTARKPPGGGSRRHPDRQRPTCNTHPHETPPGGRQNRRRTLTRQDHEGSGLTGRSAART